MQRCLNNKGEESPSYNKGLISELYNGRVKNAGLPISGNNLEYRDLKNFNWIKEQLRDDSQKHQKFERPCTRGGEKQGLDFSFIEKGANQDLAGDGSYFDRPVTRSKPRRPVSRQVRLSKKVNDSRGRGESESHRGNGELGEWDPPIQKEANVLKIHKVIPEGINNQPIQSSLSPIK